MNKSLHILRVLVALFLIFFIRANAQTPGGSSAGTIPDVGASAQRTNAPSITVVPRPKPTFINTVLPTASPTPELVSDPSTTPSNSQQGGFNPWAVGGLSVIGLAAVIGVYTMKTKTQNRGNNDENRCGGIKDLLEQKKQELKEMIKNWPQDKLKEIVEGAIVSEMDKSEETRKLLDIKKKYDKANEVIEMLQKKYDLCMLELPPKGDSFQGTIIENSLAKKEILKNLKINKSYQLEDWLLHDVTVSQKEIEKMGQYLSDGPWYMHFWQSGKDDVVVVFKNKSFNIKYSDKSTWNDAIAYGKAIGIPGEQLDFTINDHSTG